MAEQAELVLKLNVGQAKTELDQINRGMEKSRDVAEDFMKTARNAVTRGVALAAAAGAAIDRGVGGGFLSTAANLAGDFVGAGARAASQPFGGLGGIEEGVAQNKALDRAVAATQQLVGAGGNVSDEQLKGYINQFQKLFAPGSRNEQRVAVLGQEERISMAMENFNRNMAQLGDTLSRALGFAGR